MIYMILISNEEFDKYKIDELISYFYNNARTTEQKTFAPIIEEYLRDCLKLDKVLQREVSRQISKDLVLCIEIPINELDDFSTLHIYITSENGRKVKKREEILFNKLYKKYLRTFRGMISRFE